MAPSTSSRWEAPIELYILTFNCGRALVDPSLLGPHVFRALPQGARLPDLVQFSLQEIAPVAQSFRGPSHLAPFYDQLASSLNIAARYRSDGAVEYRRVVVRNVGMTALMLFAREEVAARRIRWVQTAGVGVGRLEMGNKGAVGVRFGLALGGAQGGGEEELEMSLVAAHLAPMEGAVVRRNQDWENITRRLIFANEDEEEAVDDIAPKRRGRAPAGEDDDNDDAAGDSEPLLRRESGRRSRGREVSPTPLYSTRGHVFVAGDLNYRTSSTPPDPDAYKTFPQPAEPADAPQPYLKWLPNDQLSQEMAAGRTLQGFAEQPITFPPTYKYNQPAAHQEQLITPDTDAGSPAAAVATPSTASWTSGREPPRWNWAKHRFPSWCDRILFLPSDQLRPGRYTALPLLPSSDHRPVALHVSIEPAVPKISAAGGDARRHPPPFGPDPEWRRRREAARMRELAVGTGAWLALTTEGNFLIMGLGGIILAVLFLLWKFLLQEQYGS